MRLLRIFSALIILVGGVSAQESFLYYICTYAEPTWGSSQVRIIALDINNHEQRWSTVVDLPGELQWNKPLKLRSRQQDLWFVTTHYGLPAKNSPALGTISTYYAVLDNDGAIIHTGEIPDISIGSFKSYGPDSVKIDFIQGARRDSRQFNGVLRLNGQRRPIIASSREYIHTQPDFPPIAGFEYYHPIDPANNRYFWSVQFQGTYLLALNLEDSVLVDSLNIESDVSYFYLFGMSDTDSSIYVFYMNYNRLVGPESIQKLTIDPSYVKILEASSFALVDSVPIAYPPIDSGYVGGTSGVCDRVGPYLVYYDLSSDGLEYFCPAMLFIFDTRTNEASWLRVGWR